MAITDKEQGVWELDQVYNKINQGGIWEYNGSYTGSLFTWGTQSNGGLGHNQQTTGYSSPKQVSGSTWSDVMGGGIETYMMAAVKNDGTMWTWGNNTAGMLGLNSPWATPAGNRSSPCQVGTDTDWAFRDDTVDYTDRAKFCAGQNHMLAIKSDGSLWGWGVNSVGQLGQNSTSTGNYSSPTQIGTGTDWNIAARAKDGGINCIKTDGTMWVWGYNQAYGTLGLSNKTNYSSPVQLPGTTWLGIMGQGTPVQATKTDGTLWMWGENDKGQLGLNNRTSYSSPKQVGTDTTWRNCGTTLDHAAFAFKTDGTLWTWGNNQQGELGLNEQGNRISSPAQVGTDTTWLNVVQSGTKGIVGVKNDGTLWAWGYNNDGNLGLNNKTTYSSPVQVGTRTDWSPRIGTKTTANMAIQL